MRTKNLFRTLVAATLAVVSTSAFAQTTSGTANQSRQTTTNIPTATRPEAVDFVTIGSSTPYNVTGDQEVGKLYRTVAGFQPSEFNWRVDINPTAGTNSLTPAATDNAARTVRADDGTSTLTVGTTPNYYLDTAIVVNWGNTPGYYDISVSEQSRNTLGLSTCAGADSFLQVFVMPEPIIAFLEAGTVISTDNSYDTAADNTSIVGNPNDGVIGGCGVAGQYICFNVVYSGTEDFNGYYQYQYTPFGGAAAAAVTQQPIAQQDAGTLAFYSARPDVPNEATNNGAFLFQIPAATYGKWVFTLTGVTDLVYRKSFNADATKVGSAAAESDEGVVNTGLTTANTSASLTVYSLPTPTTGAVNHITNSGW